MSLTLWILRSLGSLFLGVIIFASCLSLLLENAISNRLLAAGFYTESLIEQNAYNRIYDEILVDEMIEESTRDLLGDVPVVTHRDLVALLRDIVPPDYLQGEVEEAVRQSVAYFREDTERLEVYFNLETPLANVKPALFRYMDREIDRLETVDPDLRKSLPEQAEEVRLLIEEISRDLARGKVPGSIPSVNTIPRPLRPELFDLLLANLLADPAMDARVRKGLLDRAPDIRESFVAGDTHGFLKQSARVVAGPLIDDAIARVTRDLGVGDRIDLVASAAQWSADFTEAELRAEFKDTRDGLSRVRGFGRTMSLIILVAGALLMGAIYLPNVYSALRWPGITLLLTGLVLFALGKILAATLPTTLESLATQVGRQNPDIPPAAIDLAADVLRSLGTRLADGISNPALVLALIGALLATASFVAPLFWPGIMRRLAEIRQRRRS